MRSIKQKGGYTKIGDTDKERMAINQDPDSQSEEQLKVYHDCLAIWMIWYLDFANFHF